MMNDPATTLFTATTGLVSTEGVLAYIGPGAGLGAFVVVIALVLGALLLLTGLVWYPLKRLVRGTPADADGGDRTDATG